MTRKKGAHDERSTFSRYSKYIGVPLTGIALLVASPIIARLMRSGCYWWFGNPSLWSNPSEFLGSTLVCENIGDISFHWQDSLSWVATNFQTLAVTAGATAGVGYMMRGRRRDANASTIDMQELAESGQAYTPLHNRSFPSEEKHDVEAGYSRFKLD